MADDHRAPEPTRHLTPTAREYSKHDQEEDVLKEQRASVADLAKRERTAEAAVTAELRSTSNKAVQGGWWDMRNIVLGVRGGLRGSFARIHGRSPQAVGVGARPAEGGWWRRRTGTTTAPPRPARRENGSSNPDPGPRSPRSGRDRTEVGARGSVFPPGRPRGRGPALPGAWISSVEFHPHPKGG